MPISLDPNAYGEFALTIDKSKPENERPVFFARCLTCAQVMQVNRLLKEAKELAAGEQDKHNNLLNESLAIQLAGWRNLPTHFPPGKSDLFSDLDRILTPGEKWELIYGCLTTSQLTEVDRKKSASEQATATAGSAPLVP